MAIWIDFLIARRKATRRSSWSATFSATSWASIFGLLDLLDVEQDFLAGHLAELDLHVLDFLALLADDDAGTGGENLDADPVAGALNEDARDRGLLEFFHQHIADDLVLEEQLGEILLAREPA